MRSAKEIEALLPQLDQASAASLEGQDLDFKQWPSSKADGASLAVEAAICMANGGGGTIVFGVADKAIGRVKAIGGVPLDIDTNELRRTIHDRTDPKLSPVFEELQVPEGTGRLLIMQIHSGSPPYTDSSGRAKIRVGNECKPLTGSLRSGLLLALSDSDYTARLVPERLSSVISATAMEQLRSITQREQAPRDLLAKTDEDLLGAIGVIRNGQLTFAGLLLAGLETSIEQHLPGYLWTFLRMNSDTAYLRREDGRSALPLAVERLFAQIMVENPIQTVTTGLLHFEYRTYPEIAIREALMNAFCHADFRRGAPILVKQYSDRLELTNPGGFVGGITPENILRHTPMARNPHLVEALTRLRLVNRSNLGVPRMVESLVIEGKEPPLFQNPGEMVRVIFLARELSPSFRSLVAEEGQRGRILGLDHLLILNYLQRHSELDNATAARLTQRSRDEARETLSTMERDFGYLERGGTGKGRYWTLNPELQRLLAPEKNPDRLRRMDWEAAKTRVLSVLKDRAKKGNGLTNEEIRRMTHLDRHQAWRLMDELRTENPGRITKPGPGRGARYTYK